MKVGQLAQLLDALVQGLDGVAAGVTKDLATFRAAMGPFADKNVGEFTQFLLACEEYQRTGVVPGKARASRARQPKAAADPDLVPKAVEALKGLLAEASAAGLSEQRIDEAVVPYAGYTKPQLEQVLAGLGVSSKPRTKAAAVEKLKQLLRSQARMQDRAAGVREGAGTESRQPEPEGVRS